MSPVPSKSSQSTQSLRQRLAVFDLDEVLIDSRRAWQYAIEESVAALGGRRISAGALVAEYRRRPWAHALSILVDDAGLRVRAASLAQEMYERSALKRLLVHEGIGMALDRVRSHRIEIGAVTRLPHGFALKQVESTGLDRFITVLAATPDGEPWDLPARITQCRTFTEHAANEVDYIADDPTELSQAATHGACPFFAAWTGLAAVAEARRIATAALITDELLR